MYDITVSTSISGDEERPPNLELNSDIKLRLVSTSQTSESGKETRAGHFELFEGDSSIENWLRKDHRHEQFWRFKADDKRVCMAQA